MGYSDITRLNVAIWSQSGLVTFDDPTLIAVLAEYPQPFQYTEESFARAVQSVEPVGQPATPWTEETLSWREQVDLTRPRRMEGSPGWTWLLPGVRIGILTGGGIEPLQHFRRTRFWPGLEGAILFLVSSEEAPSPERVDGSLMDSVNMRV